MVRLEDRDCWDELVLSLPLPHVLQSLVWGELKSRWGWEVHRLGWRRDGLWVAAAQVLVRRVRGVPFPIGYVPKGPLLRDRLSVADWHEVLTDLERWASTRGLAFLKMDSDVPGSASGVSDCWRTRGWVPSIEQIQFPNTMHTGLVKDEDALLAGMHSKTRYNIRLAERRGVTIKEGGRGDIPTFYSLYAETARRAGFGIRTREYYEDAWSSLLRDGLATVLLAVREGRVLAGVIPVVYGPVCYFLFGASASHGRRHMPAYLAQWASLKWAIERDCRVYDWWGGPTLLDESDPLWGVYRFKRGFGAELVVQQGAWDYPARWLAYGLYGIAARIRRALLALRRPPE